MIDNLQEELIVVKRSGQRVPFNGLKIAIAIKKAFEQVLPDCERHVNKVYEDVLNFINDNYKDRKTINVEDIQDIIETKLKENKYKDVYVIFSKYRERRAISRKAHTIKQQHKFNKAIEKMINNNFYIDKNPDEILLNYGKTLSCEYTKAYVLDNKYVRAHEDGTIYIHNLDYFNLGKLSSAHLIFDNNSDFFYNIITNAINAKYEVDGEIAIDAIDELLVNYFLNSFKDIFKEALKNYLNVTDYLEYINFKKVEEIIDKIEKVDFDNSLFEQFILNDKVKNIFNKAYLDSKNTAINLLTKEIKNLLVNLNNNHHENKRYSISLGKNDSFEGLIINNVYLDQINNLERLNNVTTIFKIKTNDNKCLDKVTDLIITGKNIALSFVDSTYNKDSDNCIEYFSNGKRIFENPVYEEKGALGRMIVSSVSVNMSRLGFMYENKPLNDFYNKLDEILDLAKNCLVEIFETIGDKNKDNYQVIFNNNLLDDKKLESGQKIRKIIKKGVLNLELAGLYECVLNLEKDSLKQKELIKDILKHIEDKSKTYTLESKLNFIVSETSKHRPLKKLIEIDKSIYGIKKGLTDKKYYSRIDNLFNFKKDLNEDLKYVGSYQKLLSGGCLTKIKLKKASKNEINKIIDLAIVNDIGFISFEVDDS